MPKESRFLGKGCTGDEDYCKDPLTPRTQPTSRPIVWASKGLTTQLGELLSDLVEPISRMIDRSREARSTKEVLRMIGKANEELERLKVKEVVLYTHQLIREKLPKLL